MKNIYLPVFLFLEYIYSINQRNFITRIYKIQSLISEKHTFTFFYDASMEGNFMLINEDDFFKP